MSRAEQPRRAGQQGPTGDGEDEAVRASMHDPHFVRLLVDATPDVRSERVQALRQTIQLGAYELDPRRVAEGMIRNLTRPRR